MLTAVLCSGSGCIVKGPQLQDRNGRGSVPERDSYHQRVSTVPTQRSGSSGVIPLLRHTPEGRPEFASERDGSL
jgi:hypothetical protein